MAQNPFYHTTANSFKAQSYSAVQVLKVYKTNDLRHYNKYLLILFYFDLFRSYRGCLDKNGISRDV